MNLTSFCLTNSKTSLEQDMLDFVNTLNEFKTQNVLRECCFKSSLINIYQPMIQFIAHRIIDKFVDIEVDEKDNVTCRGVTEAIHSISSMRDKFLNKSGKTTNLKLK